MFRVLLCTRMNKVMTVTFTYHSMKTMKDVKPRKDSSRKIYYGKTALNELYCLTCNILLKNDVATEF